MTCTWFPKACVNAGSTAPVVVDTAAKFLTGVPLMKSNFPPMYSVEPSADTPRAFT